MIYGLHMYFYHLACLRSVGVEILEGCKDLYDYAYNWCIYDKIHN